jgi:hypothetical protein
MRNKIYSLLTKPPVVIITIVVSSLLSYIDRNYNYFFGITVALIILWASKFRWAEFGFATRITAKTIFSGLIISVIIFLLVDVLIQPFLEIYLGAIDLSSLDGIRNNFTSYFIMLIVMWLLAAFGEEFLFRGYYMKRLAALLGDSDKGWLISAILISIYFGIAHSYQGLAGMIAVGIAGFCFSMIFYKNRENLALAVFAHGFYDMIGLTLLYYSKERIIVEWVEKML